MSNPVQLLDEQSPEGVTTYFVDISHMDHHVNLYQGEDRDRASEIEFVLRYEFDRLYAAIKAMRSELRRSGYRFAIDPEIAVTIDSVCGGAR